MGEGGGRMLYFISSSILLMFSVYVIMQHNIETSWAKSRAHKLTTLSLIMTSTGIVMVLLELMFLKGVCKLRQNLSRITDIQDAELLEGSELDRGLHRANHF